ncbi:MAG TPA: phosphatase domain-containing protein, partial [Pyrinomonadaceae bacterium]|nr:phosphatase domain-containing protein [Pyrinomonadaceae bacterium]
MPTIFPIKLTIYSTILNFIFFGSCSKPQLPKPSDIIPQLKKSAPARLQPVTEEEVTFYPTYGYKKDGAWHIHLRGWVHENREHVNRFLTKIAEVKDKCAGAELTNFQFRSDDFEDDDKSHETVIVKFDSDPQDQAFTFPRSESVGIVEMDLVLPDDRAKQLLDKQGSANGWLTFRAVSGDHTGLGRVRLIEAEGVSVVSDIDDTIKVTDIPAGQNIVLRNTFCRDFQAAPDMAKMYSDFGDVAFHYV